MSAPKRSIPLTTRIWPVRRGLREALRRHTSIGAELEQLAQAADKEVRRTQPQFHTGISLLARYQHRDVIEALVGDLEAAVSRKDWRAPLERTADRLRRAAKHIRKAVRLALRAARDCPTYATIPTLVWESTPDAEAEQQRIAALPAGDRLVGSGGAIASLRERERRTVVNPGRIAPEFLKAMLVYAAPCDREAHRLESILKVRDKRFDRLGPVLKLIHDVQSFTGKPNDAIVARLLADAFEVAGTAKQFSPDAIRKIRERHLAS